MGVQKNLAQAKKDLEAIKKLVEKPDVIAARTAVDKVKQLLAATGKAAEEKYKKAEDGISKLAEAVNECVTLAGKKPLDADKVVAIINKATAAAAAAVQANAPAP